MDRQALITSLFGITIGAIGCYFRGKRDWWKQVSMLGGRRRTRRLALG
jgi:hypothetical protein